MKQVKRFIYLSLTVFICLGCITGSRHSQSYAGAVDKQQTHAKLNGFVYTKPEKKILTRQQVNAKITTLEQQIQTLKSRKKTEEAREKRERAGATYLYAEVVCSSPYILYDTLSSGYFWVNDNKYLNNLWVAATGYVKLTGNYRTYNGITCAECYSVKVNNKSVGIQKQINSKKKELKKCKNALKDKVTLESQRIKAGKKAKISKSWKYSGAYNALTWKSSNEEIASIDGNGKVTAVKEGTVTITAKASISGIISKCRVTVWEEEDTEPDLDTGNEFWQPHDEPDEETDDEPYEGTAESEMHFDEQEYYLEDSSFATVYLYVNLKEGDDYEEIFIDSSNENVAVYNGGQMKGGNRYEITFLLTGAGTTTITATADNGLSAQCTLTHYIDME